MFKVELQIVNLIENLYDKQRLDSIRGKGGQGGRERPAYNKTRTQQNKLQERWDEKKVMWSEKQYSSGVGRGIWFTALYLHKERERDYKV